MRHACSWQQSHSRQSRQCTGLPAGLDGFAKADGYFVRTPGTEMDITTMLNSLLPSTAAKASQVTSVQQQAAALTPAAVAAQRALCLLPTAHCCRLAALPCLVECLREVGAQMIGTHVLRADQQTDRHKQPPPQLCVMITA